MRVLLVDNGSLEIAAYQNLCSVAHALAELTGRQVRAAPLLHANRVPPEENGGERIRVWHEQISDALQEGEREFGLLPFFFGPSRAITVYVPEKLEELRAQHGDFKHHVAPCLFQADVDNDLRLAKILRDRIRETIESAGLERPRVILVDHGSPIPSVTFVRNYVAGQLSVLLRDEVSALAVASMERREGDLYAFNDPLLEHKLDEPGFNAGAVVIAMLFLSPGRHAGPGGDVATICSEAQQRHPHLRTYMTDLVGTHPGVVDLLRTRLLSLGR